MLTTTPAVPKIIATILAALSGDFTYTPGWNVQTPPDPAKYNEPRETLTIHRSPGGTLSAFTTAAQVFRLRGTTIRVDGPCNSACHTMVELLASATARAPAVCITPHASFTLHAARRYRERVGDESPENLEWIIPANYTTARIKAWIAERGGWPHTHAGIKMSYTEARKF